ncbi:hypothetical protein [Elizabethkingia anophelis]|uniref:hypothetical protein n=1 Tax=Elizabethkingia anophelis TaxID=1117645 RepID=UPI00301CF9B9
MEFDKLISINTFNKLLEKKAYSEYKVLKENYKSFVELPLTLEMIVPVNSRGGLIKEPVFPSPEYGINLYAYETFLDDKDIFQKAKENLLFEFEDYEIADDIIFFNKKQIRVSVKSDYFLFNGRIVRKIEDLIFIEGIEFILTPKALEIIYRNNT